MKKYQYHRWTSPERISARSRQESKRQRAQKAGASNLVAKDSKKDSPVIMDVVATRYSTLFSSCCERNLRAATSAMVQPPTNITITTLGPPWLLGLASAATCWVSSKLGPGSKSRTSLMFLQPGLSSCWTSLTERGAYTEWT